MSINTYRKYFLEMRPAGDGEWTRSPKFSIRYGELAALAVIFAAVYPEYIYRIVERNGQHERVLLGLSDRR